VPAPRQVARVARLLNACSRHQKALCAPPVEARQPVLL